VSIQPHWDASAVQQTNGDPFRHGRWLWMHNVLPGVRVVKRDLALAVDPDLYSQIMATRRGAVVSTISHGSLL
jgi:hypothetical protein